MRKIEPTNSVKFEQPTIEKVRAAYNNTENPEIKALLCNLYGESAMTADNRPITERVKTFEDACRELGEKHPFVVQYTEMYENFLDGADERNSADIIAYLKLRIIAAALNEGWTPQYVKGEEKWWPWYWLYTQKEIDQMDDERKSECVLFGGAAPNGASAGFAYACSNNAPSDTTANIGSRLCVKSEALSDYFGKQFIKIWQDFYFG